MEEGDGGGEGAYVEAEHAVEEEQFHLMVLLPWGGLELGLCALVREEKTTC